MKMMASILITLALLAPLSLAASAQSQAKPLILTHVTVIHATGTPAKADMTVVIVGGRIAAIGKSKKVRIRRGAQTIDATGKYLIPGLWDMHAHIGSESFDRDASLSIFVANGVTGIRIMSGVPEHHKWRKEIESGKLLGPRLVIASRTIDGPKSFVSGTAKVSNEAEAREAVRTARKEGADFVKVHDTLSRDAYFAVIDEAKRLGLQVEGHVPAAITAKEASEAGQKSIEHFTGLAQAETDTTEADRLIAIFKKNRTWICPTLIMRNNYAILDDATLANDPRLRYVKPSWKNSWLSMTEGAGNIPAAEWAGRREIVRREKALVGRFQKSGVGLLAGTDDISPYVFPGFSLHDELVMLVESGLSPLQALQTATINPARFLNQIDSLGTVEKGNLADLVLLDANPLEDIHNTSRISAVVVRGRYLDKSALSDIFIRVEKAAR